MFTDYKRSKLYQIEIISIIKGVEEEYFKSNICSWAVIDDCKLISLSEDTILCLQGRSSTFDVLTGSRLKKEFVYSITFSFA